MTPSAINRARAVGQAIQSSVAQSILDDPKQAGNPVYIGLDAISSTMIRKPESLDEMIPWVELATAAVGFVMHGTWDERLAVFGLTHDPH
jgi:hypothetical protein